MLDVVVAKIWGVANSSFAPGRSRARFGATYEESGDGSASTDGKDGGHFFSFLMLGLEYDERETWVRGWFVDCSKSWFAARARRIDWGTTFFYSGVSWSGDVGVSAVRRNQFRQAASKYTTALQRTPKPKK